MSHYDVHGVHLAIDADHPEVTAAVDRRLRHFRTSPPAPTDGVTIEMRIGAAMAPCPPEPSSSLRPVLDTPEGQMLYDEAGDVLSLDFGRRGWLVVEPRAGRARIWAASADGDGVWLVSHPLLTLAVTELLKRRGRFPLHAAAMTRSAGGVLLFAGASGAGKTTLAVGLLRQGWGFLADDTVFLTPAPAPGATPGTAVLAFPDEIDVTASTLSMFPELGPAPGTASVAGRAKRQLVLEEEFGVEPRLAGRAVAVVFPVVAHRSESTLTPVGPGQALADLAPNVVLTEPVSSQAHFDALATLVATVPCWRLETGSDFRSLERLLTGALDC